MPTHAHINKLTNQQIFALGSILKELDLKPFSTLEALALYAQGQMNIRVTTANVRGALEMIGRELPAINRRNVGVQIENMATLANAVANLYRKANLAPPADVLALCANSFDLKKS